MFNLDMMMMTMLLLTMVMCTLHCTYLARPDTNAYPTHAHVCCVCPFDQMSVSMYIRAYALCEVCVLP